MRVARDMKAECVVTERFYFSALEFIFHWLPNVLITVASLAVIGNF
jgi:hypothetical protein